MNPNQTKPNQTKRWLSFVFLMGVIPAESLAQAGTCQTTALRTADNKRIEYKVNTGNMPNGITADNGIYAVIRSADLWNEQSNSSTFRYIGSTTETSLPALYSDCVSQNKLYSIVIFAQASGSFGLNTRKCIDGNSVSHAAEIRTYRQNMAGTAYPWGVGDLGAGQWDLIHNIAHELGHSLQINHPMNGEAAVMQQGVFNSTRYRDLYEYDIKCAEELGDQRALSGYRKAHSGGSFSSTSNWTGGWPFIGGWAASKGTVGVTWLSGSVYWSASAIRQSSNFSETPFGHYWTRNLDTGNTKLVVGNGYLYAIAPLVAVWRENTTIDRVFYSESRDFPTRWTDVGSSRRLTQRYSSNEFSTTTTTPMYGCTSMSGWMTCGGVALIHTGKRVSVAWDNAITRSHTAWSQQNRATDNDSRRLWIATGNVSDSRLPIANGLPAPAGVATLRSSVSPGLACQTGAAGGYNCIAAYVDDSNGLPDVRVQRFSATSGATHFGLNTEGVARVVLGNVRTYSDIAAWFHNGKFYVAIRPARVNQNLEVYSSSNGATWQFEGTFEHTAVGPSAVSYWTGNNQLIWFD